MENSVTPVEGPQAVFRRFAHRVGEQPAGLVDSVRETLRDRGESGAGRGVDLGVKASEEVGFSVAAQGVGSHPVDHDLPLDAFEEEAGSAVELDPPEGGGRGYPGAGDDFCDVCLVAQGGSIELRQEDLGDCVFTVGEDLGGATCGDEGAEVAHVRDGRERQPEPHGRYDRAMSTPDTSVHRLPNRGRYDRETIDAILDEGLVAHVGLVEDGHPVVIPVAYARDGDAVLIHGSPASRMLRTFKKGAPACLTVTLLDGLVLAKSAFNHSMNYRSAVLFGEMEEVSDLDEKYAALTLLTEALTPGRSSSLRPMTEKEVRGTTVLRMAIDAASAKVREGGPVDPDEDADFEVWTGVIPRVDTWGPAIPTNDVDVPDHVTGYRRA